MSTITEKVKASTDADIERLAARVVQLEAHLSRLRRAGCMLAAQTRSYQRGFSGTPDLGIALNNWDSECREGFQIEHGKSIQ